MTNNSVYNREVYVVDGARSPFLKARSKPAEFAAADLAVATCQPLLARQPFSATDIDEVITGCTMPSADEANISRIIALRLGCGDAVPAWTVQRNCASGMQAIDNAAMDIASGRHNLVLCGGVDIMSRAPLLFNQAMGEWLGSWLAAKTTMAKLKVLANLRPKLFVPIIALLRGLTDPVVGLSMGQTAENLAFQFNISRTQMDEFASRSHHRLAQTQADKAFKELVTVFSNAGHFYDFDDGVRADSTVEKLAKLKPYFDKKFGQVTAGNSSQITDGAAFLLLASGDAVKKYNLPVLGQIKDAQWAALSPAIMGLGPVYASTPLMQRHKLLLNDIDYWEINEAFAAQVLACLEAWDDDDFCREHLGVSAKFGKLDQERLNVRGGAIGLGHPIGASGARIVLQLLEILRDNDAQYGMASICIGGGQGGAMLLENINCSALKGATQ